MKFPKNIFDWSLFGHGIYFLFLLGIVVFTIFGDSGLYQLHSLNRSRERLKYQINELNSKTEATEREKELLTDPRYLESIIRKELGYIKDGEVVYQVEP